jgi:pyrroline-5-carboxylate reductase
MLETHNIAVIGAGTMGRAITTGMIRAGVVRAPQISVADRTPASAESLSRELGVRAASDNADACRDAEIVLLCVKPNDVAGVVESLREANALWPRALIISIAAGVTTQSIERYAGGTAAVVRAMPNTACLISKGMTVVAAGARATSEHVDAARTIFATLGRCLTLDEKHLNVVTGLSGSGPAFLYVVMEALADGGVMCGLPRAVATELVAQVALGAAEMILTTGKHPSALKDDVTTPGGCTIAGLLAMEDGKIRSVLARAVETAAHVAGGLGATPTKSAA